MERCDFSSVVNIVMNYIAESKKPNQLDLMLLLFESFMRDDASITFDFDNGKVCRWINGNAKVSPQITGYYADENNKHTMVKDIEKNILPIMYDADMAFTELHNLIRNDLTVSDKKKDELCNECGNAEFITRLICFGMERTFIKRDTKTQAMLMAGTLSPIVSDFIYDCFVPKPCKHFVGRDTEIEEIHNLLQKHDKLFINGVAGIGKSEFVKKYAERYKNEYTNILYFNYNRDLYKIIADCDFADDSSLDDEAKRFKRHNRFLRSLKQNTLIIIDNFNVSASYDKLLDVIMKYRCRVLFATRSQFEQYHCYEIKELSVKTLLQLVEHFYTGSQETVTQIIYEVHCHTMSVELAARLLVSGISEPEELLQKLQAAKAVLNTEDEIGIIKDGINNKATYYQHIHTLVSLSMLSAEAQNIMRNMCFIPSYGIDCRLFAGWIKLKNLNEVNNLIELGFVRLTAFRKISLHPLINEITIDDTSPSVSNCVLVEAIRQLCLLRGIDLPYYKLIFSISENILRTAKHDDTTTYKLFLKDIFGYMEKQKYKKGMELILSELKELSDSNEDNAILYDYKAAYEHICNRNDKAALKYSAKAAKLCADFEQTNSVLASNIYANLSSLYHADGRLEKAKKYAEKAYNILKVSDMEYLNDSLIQLINIANLTADMGKPMQAVEILKSCAKRISSNSSDYGDIHSYIGQLYLSIGNIEPAAKHFRIAIDAYSGVWQNEPERLQEKISEQQQIINVCRSHDDTPFFDKILVHSSLE